MEEMRKQRQQEMQAKEMLYDAEMKKSFRLNNMINGKNKIRKHAQKQRTHGKINHESRRETRQGMKPQNTPQ